MSVEGKGMNYERIGNDVALVEESKISSRPGLESLNERDYSVG